MAFVLKQNDSRPAYMAVLKDNFGLSSEAPIDLTAATEVFFVMRLEGTTDVEGPKIKNPATVDDAVAGIVSYAWQTGDTDQVGVFNVEFEINWSDGSVETVPNEGYNQIQIVDDLG